MCPAGMDSNTSGIVSNMRPNPLERPGPMNRTTAGTIIRPDRKATQESIRHIVYADFSMSTFFLM